MEIRNHDRGSLIYLRIENIARIDDQDLMHTTICNNDLQFFQFFRTILRRIRKVLLYFNCLDSDSVTDSNSITDVRRPLQF